MILLLYAVVFMASGALIGGYFYRFFFEKQYNQNLDAITKQFYHMGFQDGMDKLKKDQEAENEAMVNLLYEKTKTEGDCSNCEDCETYKISFDEEMLPLDEEIDFLAEELNKPKKNKVKKSKAKKTKGKSKRGK